jgi:hypothetical protein
MGIATAFVQAGFPVGFLLLSAFAVVLAALVLFWLFTAQH